MTPQINMAGLAGLGATTFHLRQVVVVAPILCPLSAKSRPVKVHTRDRRDRHSKTPDEVTLLCQRCGRPFKTAVIREICPPCNYAKDRQ
jgi:hypothetical protein